MINHVLDTEKKIVHKGVEIVFKALTPAQNTLVESYRTKNFKANSEANRHYDAYMIEFLRYSLKSIKGFRLIKFKPWQLMTNYKIINMFLFLSLIFINAFRKLFYYYFIDNKEYEVTIKDDQVSIQDVIVLEQIFTEFLKDPVFVQMVADNINENSALPEMIKFVKQPVDFGFVGPDNSDLSNTQRVIYQYCYDLNYLTSKEYAELGASIKYLLEPRYQCLNTGKYVHNGKTMAKARVDQIRLTNGCFKPVRDFQRIHRFEHFEYYLCPCNFYDHNVSLYLEIAQHYEKFGVLPFNIYREGQAKLFFIIKVINNYLNTKKLEEQKELTKKYQKGK